MKKIILISTLLFTTLTLAQIKIKPKVTAVKLYYTGAEITQRAKVKLDNSNQVIFTGLAESINENTVSVKAKNAKILSISNRFNYVEPYEQDERVIALKAKIDSLQKLNDASLAIIAELESRNQFLKNLPQGGNLTFNELKKLTNYYEKEAKKIYSEMLVEKRKSKELEELLRKYKKQLNEIAKQGKKVNEIVVSVFPNDETAEFEIHYFTTAAGWKPEYDLKAYSNKNIVLGLKAVLTQKTGITWKNIPLSFSSRILNQNNDKPELPVWWISFYSQQQMRMAKAPNSFFAAESKNNLDLAAVRENQFDIEYEIAASPLIYSSNKVKLIELKTYEIEGKYKYYGVPKLSDNAFLVAEIPGWNKLHLIDGKINLFYDDAYVGNSYLRTNSAKDLLTLSLGKDNNISLRRKVIKDYTESIMLSSDVKRSFEIEVELKNNKGTDVELILEENIPVSKNEDIVVIPEDLAGAKLNTKNGKLKWNIKLKSGEKRTVKYSFSVRYPEDKQIGGI